MIIVADENSKIVGIYPNYIVQNVPYILKNHRNLLDRFDFCYNVEMPKNLKIDYLMIYLTALDFLR